MHLSNRLKNFKYSQTLAMTARSRYLKSLGYDIINLSVGEPDFSPPDFILKASKKAIDEGHHYYTPVAGNSKLIEIICNKFKRDNNICYTHSQIIVSNGVKQSIINVLLSILNSEDEIIIPAPYWVSYYQMAKLCEANPIIIYSKIENNYKITPEELEKAITNRTKAFIFSSPCNPTGSIYSKNELKVLSKVFSKYPNIIIISDEIYEYIRYNNEHISIATFPEVYNQTVTLNGISKAYAMTGWRIGYIGAPEWLAKACEKIQGQTTSCANSIAQCAAIAALESSPKNIEYMISTFKKRLDMVIDLLNDIPGFVLSNKPQGAFYVFPNVSNFLGRKFNGQLIKNTDDLAKYLLETAHVSTVSGTAFGEDNSLRISYAVSEQKLQNAFKRIKNSLKF
ncbi:MAG: pyridoxal phosphate-dependent aminotransferase [Candidatus Bostrichicola ureolyticus]|nr:MAG: pyridoxal phosphate-dependent aminotransferase [Candidatus Bostrichicola ureolyticus]